MPRLDLEDLKRRLYGNGAEAWEVEALLDVNAALRGRLDAVERLLACYRVGEQPTMKLFSDLDTTRDALVAIDQA